MREHLERSLRVPPHYLVPRGGGFEQCMRLSPQAGLERRARTAFIHCMRFFVGGDKFLQAHVNCILDYDRNA